MATNKKTYTSPLQNSSSAREIDDSGSKWNKVIVGNDDGDEEDDNGDEYNRHILSLTISAVESQKEEALHLLPSRELVESKSSCILFETLCRRYGLVLMSIAPLIFSVHSLLVDVLTDTLDSFQVVFMHVPVLMICCTFLIIYKGVRPSRDYKHYFWLLCSGTFQATNTCFLALALTYMAVGDTITIMYSALIQVGFFSWIILKEAVRLFDLLFVIIAFGGVAFIARPPFIFRVVGETAYDIPILGIIYAIAGSITVALFVVCNRKLSKLEVNSFFCLFFNSVSAVLFSGVLCLILNRWRCPTIREWLYALLAGVCYALGHVSLFNALKTETATLVTVLSTTEIAWAYLWQLVILHLPPMWTSYVGAILILVACIGITVKNKPPTPGA